ncbi:MAG: hypothetical protein HY300_13980 [Verrucomicrobia bacterium]|nr:hypothetical protein [Verrucomicrobiota bacterium]
MTIEKESLLRKIERFAVIFASLLGAIAFFWQLIVHFENKREILDAQYKIVGSADGYQLKVEVSNLGERSTSLKTVALTWRGRNQPNSASTSIELTSEQPRVQTIEPGGFREYFTQKLPQNYYLNLASEGGESLALYLLTSRGGEIRFQRMDLVLASIFKSP